QLHGLPRFRLIGWIRSTFVKDHDDIGPQVALDLHGSLWIEKYRAAIDWRFKRNPRLSNFSQLTQAEYLEAAGVSQDWPLPLHEIVRSAMKLYHFCPRTEHPAEGIAEDDLRTGIHHTSRQRASHGAIGTHWQERSCFNNTARKLQAAAAGVAGLGIQFKLHKGLAIHGLTFLTASGVTDFAHLLRGSDGITGNKHGIAITEKAVTLLHGDSIGLHGMAVTGKCRYQHQQC